MIIRNIHNEEELAESRLLCYKAFKENIDDCPSLEAAMDMFLHCPTTHMKREWKNSMAAFDEQAVMFAQISCAIAPIHFDGKTSQMCTIGDVACIRKGTDAIMALFHALLSQRRKEGVAFSYLFPFSGRYYSQFGYSYCVMCKKWLLNLIQLDRADHGIRVRPYTPMDAPYSEELQRACVGRYNLSMQRTPITWHTARYLSHLITAVAVSSQDIPLGYLTYTTRGQEETRVKITDWTASSPKVLNALLLSLPPHIQSATLVAPDDFPLELMLGELNLHNATCAYQNNGMVRIVDVKAALLAMSHRGSGSLVLEVEDPLLLENTGRWELVWEDGETRTVQRTAEKDPDLSLGIGELSRFVCAGVTKESLRFFAGIPETLAPLLLTCFPHKAVGVFDYF